MSLLMCAVCFCFFFFVFKQKTAYEMRISDWSSDVCSSDLSFADADAAEVPAGTIRIIDIPNAAPATPGTPDPRNAVAVIAALEGAAAACITGTFRAEERRVGKECVSTCSSRWSRYH